MLKEEEVEAIIEAIYQRYRLDFSNYERSSLKRRLSKAMYKFKLDSAVDLWRKMLYEPNFIHELIDTIAVNLTEPFRNADLWKFLRRKVLPLLFDRPQIHIWHAGCATGEEVYSFMILLKETNLLHKAHILATDINPKALEVAHQGKYTIKASEQFQQNYFIAGGIHDIRRYCSITSHYVVFDKIQQEAAALHFRQHNLIQDPIDGCFDLIFCRNVFIYFDPVLKMRVLKTFYEHGHPESLLVMGYYDSLPQNHEEYFELLYPKHKIYLRKE
jgi:chemotaxis protein methyltransferase CheR